MPTSYIFQCANTSAKICEIRDRLLSTRLDLIKSIWDDPNCLQNLLDIQQSFNNNCDEMIKSAVGLDEAIKNGEFSENMVAEANREIASICCAIWDAERLPENYPMELLAQNKLLDMYESAKNYKDRAPEMEI